jgi:hypothetical protein
MKLWKMKKRSDFDHEIMNLVEKIVGTLAILGKTLTDKFTYLFSSFQLGETDHLDYSGSIIQRKGAGVSE